MVHYAFQNPPVRIRRLRYRSGLESLTFSYNYPERKRTETESVSSVEKKSKVSWIHELEGMLDEMKNADNEDERIAPRYAEIDWASASLHDESEDLTWAESSEERSPAVRSGAPAGHSDGTETETEREANERSTSEAITWAGSMAKGSSVEETVGAAGHPDAAEVMQSETSKMETEREADERSTQEAITWAGSMTKGSSVEETVGAAGHPDAAEVMQSETSKMETEREADERSTQEAITWAGPMTKGSSVEETVGAAGHPDAAEVMQSETSKGSASANQLPEVQEIDTIDPYVAQGASPDHAQVNSGMDKGILISQDPIEQDRSPIGQLAESSTAEDVAAAAGHPDNVPEPKPGKSQPSELSSLTASSVQSVESDSPDIKVPVAFTAEIAVVREVDIMLPDRSVP